MLTIITTAKEVMSLSEFVCLLAGLRQNYSADFTKFGKTAHWPQKI